MTDSESSMPVLPESEARQLAELACVPEFSRECFCKMLALEIETAHLANENLMNAETGKMEIVRAPDVQAPLSRVAAAAQELDRALGALRGEGAGFGPAAASAGSLLEIALGRAAGKEVLHVLTDLSDSEDPAKIVQRLKDAAFGFMARLDAYRNWLETLIAAADEAGKLADVGFMPKRKPGGTKGVGGNLLFDHFVFRLYEMAWLTGAKGWTHYRNGHGNWKGTLAPALNLLRPYLPDFVPKRDLGYALERLHAQFGTDPAGNKSMH